MPENKVFMCEHCGKKFPNESELVNHQSQLSKEYFGIVDRTFDDDLEKFG